MHKTHSRHTDSPKHHDRWNEDTRPQAFEQNIREGFETCIADEEQRKCSVVLSACHVEVFDEPIDFGVADVRSI